MDEEQNAMSVILDSWKKVADREFNWNSEERSWTERTFDYFGHHDYFTQGKPLLTDTRKEIEQGLSHTANFLREQSQEKENTLNPLSYTDDVLRLAGGGLKNTAWAIDQLDKAGQDNSNISLLDSRVDQKIAYIAGNVLRATNFASEKGADVAGWVAKETGWVDEKAARFVGSFAPDLLLAGASKAGLLSKGARSLNTATKAAFGEDILGAARRASIPKKGIIRKGIDNVIGDIRDATAPVGVTDTGILAKIPNQQRSLTELLNKPLASINDTRVQATGQRNWGAIEKALEAQDTKTLAKLFEESSPFYNQLSPDRKVISIAEVANDLEFVSQLVGRNKGMTDQFIGYVRATASGDFKKAGRLARTLNDYASKNPFDPSKIIYGNSGIRKQLKNAFVEFTGQEWHHIFGNKEIGEAFLTKLAGEPMMAANMFKLLDDLKVPTSGVAGNMGLAVKALHTGKSSRQLSIHQFTKQFGLEPWTNPRLQGGQIDFVTLGRNKKLSQTLTGKPRLRYPEGKFTAPLDLGDHLKEISEAVLIGTTHPDEFIDILRVYAKMRDQFLLPKLKEIGMRHVTDIKGVERFIIDL